MRKTILVMSTVFLLVFSMVAISAYAYSEGHSIQSVMKYNTDPISQISNEPITPVPAPRPHTDIPIEQAQNAIPNTYAKKSSSSSGGGGGILTQWGWNGQECIKRDVYSRPLLTNKNSKFSDQFVILGDAGYGKVWRAKIIPGKYGIVLKESGYGLQREPNCDTSQTNVEPLSISWWRTTTTK